MFIPNKDHWCTDRCQLY